jgi:nicotinamidase/pyrazinamidase
LYVEADVSARPDESGPLTRKDALVIVDLQRDFLPGGSLAVGEADRIVPLLSRHARRVARSGVPVVLTRDWHPPHHTSFAHRGGPWPAHCVAGTSGAEFPNEFEVPAGSVIVSKGSESDRDAYSGFEGTDLDAKLRSLGVDRLFVGGVATEFCVLHTVRDALSKGYHVSVLADAIRPVDAGEGARALSEMIERGAIIRELEKLEVEAVQP